MSTYLSPLEKTVLLALRDAGARQGQPFRTTVDALIKQVGLASGPDSNERVVQLLRALVAGHYRYESASLTHTSPWLSSLECATDGSVALTVQAPWEIVVMAKAPPPSGTLHSTRTSEKLLGFELVGSESGNGGAEQGRIAGIAGILSGGVVGRPVVDRLESGELRAISGRHRLLAHISLHGYADATLARSGTTIRVREADGVLVADDEVAQQ